MKINVLTKNCKKGEEIQSHFLHLNTLLIVFVLFISKPSYAQIGTWSKVTNKAPHDNEGVMLLMTDGTILVHTSSGIKYGSVWDKLIPSATGSYVNGTWASGASAPEAMNYGRLYFGSQVLPNGQVFVVGGEYGSGKDYGEVYDPVANIWTSIGTYSDGGTTVEFADCNSEILPNGNIIIGPQFAPDPSYPCIYYIASTNTFTVAPTAPLNHDEAQWLKLPDSSILFVGIGSTHSCRFRPQTNTWISDANLPVNIFDTYGEESGCATMLPNGKAIFFGATPHNAIYTPSGSAAKGIWIAAPDFPIIGNTYVGQTDAPGAMMVNGHELLGVSPVGTNKNDEFRAPTYFVEYDYVANKFTQVTSVLPGLGTDSIPKLVSNYTNMLDLPDGTVLLGVQFYGSTSSQYWVYTPGSTTIPQGKPTIDNVIPDSCSFYKITGKLFNGISEGATFGDDWQNSTNYPLVRLTNAAGNVYYAKTTNWNRIGAVQTDSLEDTAYFALPSVPGGTYSLVVVVNGFASNPVLFTTFGVSILSQINASCDATADGSATAIAANGTAPYTYVWFPSGGTNATASNLSAGTYTVIVTESGNGCSVSTTVTIQPYPLTISPTAVWVGCSGSGNGVASSNINGGKSPYTYSWTGGGGTNAIASGLSAGTYTITVSDSCGSSTSTSVVITQPASLTAATSSTGDNGTNNGTASVTASGGIKPYTYLWEPGGKTTTNIAGLSAGTYTCTITDNNGCMYTTSVTVKNTTGVEEISVSSNINIYPSPNTGSFKIEGVLQGQVIELYNVLGQLLNSVKADNTTMYFNISNQANGIYLIRILNTDGSLATQKKLVKTQ